jgi:hypothetical protein
MKRNSWAVSEVHMFALLGGLRNDRVCNMWLSIKVNVTLSWCTSFDAYAKCLPKRCSVLAVRNHPVEEQSYSRENLEVAYTEFEMSYVDLMHCQ